MPRFEKRMWAIGFWLCAAACALVVAARAAAAPSPFATRVIAYDPAPGSFVNNPLHNDPSRALGAPVGGGPGTPDNGKCVTLGGFGGSITLGFDRPIMNLEPSVTNPRGCDLIVFGNAFYAGGDPARRFAEAATIEVSRDDNGNGVADDVWYLIRGAHSGLPGTPPVLVTKAWDDDIADTMHPPASVSWLPPGKAGVWTTSAHVLPVAPYSGPVVVNPLGEGSLDDGVWGYADCTPVLALGDLNADGFIDEGVDDAAIPAERFYGWPDDPMTTGVWAMSCGGDAVDLSWAVTADGAPALLDRADFVRITTAVDRVSAVFAEASAEVSGVSIVRPRLLADVVQVGGAWPPDGQLTLDDILAFVNAYVDEEALADLVSVGGALPPDGQRTLDDILAFVDAYVGGG